MLPQILMKYLEVYFQKQLLSCGLSPTQESWTPFLLMESHKPCSNPEISSINVPSNPEGTRAQPKPSHLQLFTQSHLQVFSSHHPFLSFLKKVTLGQFM